MNPRRIKQLLWSSAAALTCAAVAVVLIGSKAPAPPVDDVRLTAAAKLDEHPPRTVLPPLEDLHRVAEIPLRRMLTETSPPATQAVVAAADVAPAPAEMPFTLVGTIGTSLAMLRAADGTTSLAGIGDSAAGVKVISVNPSQVEVEFNQRTVTLEKPKEELPPG
jgi:hypothetical protein